MNKLISLNIKPVKQYNIFLHNLFFFLRYQDKQNSHSFHSFALYYWRKIFFFIQAFIHCKIFFDLFLFFQTSFRSDILLANPCILQQPIRQWFYYHSKIQERTFILVKHFTFLEDHISTATLKQLYLKKGILLWREFYKNNAISLSLTFNSNYRKEGLLALTLTLDETRIYLLTFWIAPDYFGKNSLWIGALQGGKSQLQTNRTLTKLFFGYRPQNLVLHTLYLITQHLQIEQIYAVSNYGFQASHHLSPNRRLKTSYDKFWLESQGTLCFDKRFFALPSHELRKPLEAVPSHKRNLYRKRYAFLDLVNAKIKTVLNSL
jgi:hypothetical protein